MKKLYIAIGIILLVFVAMTFSNYRKIESAKAEIAEIGETVENAKTTIENYKIVKNLEMEIREISENFVLYHTSGDYEKLKEIVSEDVEISKSNGKLYGKVESNGIIIDWLLFDSNSEEIYSHMEIQGYGYLDDEEILMVHIREYYYREDGNDVTPPTFLNLFLKNLDEKWIVAGFEFDV